MEVFFFSSPPQLGFKNLSLLTVNRKFAATSAIQKGDPAKEGTPFGPVATRFVKTETCRKAAASPKTPVVELRLSVNNKITEMKSADKKKKKKERLRES